MKRSMYLCLFCLLYLAGCSGEDTRVGAQPGTAADNVESGVGDADVPAGAVVADPSSDNPPEVVGPPAAAPHAETKSVEIQKPREVQEISFDDLNLQLQADVVFRPWMLSDRARELDGHWVRIAGYMLPHDRTEGIEAFVLLRNNECKFGPGGQPDHLVSVTLRSGQKTSYRNVAVSVEGQLRINPFTGPDGNTWYIYELNEADGVATLRR